MQRVLVGRTMTEPRAVTVVITPETAPSALETLAACACLAVWTLLSFLAGAAALAVIQG
jgi:hypothetical protein